MVGDEHPRSASDALAPLIDDRYSDVRAAALSALGTLRARHLSERIATRLEDGDSTVRQQAAVALAEAGGDRALELLRASLESAYPDVRFQSLLGVLSLDARAGFEAAMSMLPSDDPWIAAEAAETLGRLFAVDADHRIENDLRDDDRSTALAAVEARRVSASDRVAFACSVALVRAGELHAAVDLCAYVRGERAIAGDDREAMLSEAMELLGSISGEHEHACREALARVAWRVIPSPERAVARAALARLGDARAAEELIEQLRSLLPGRREAAVRLVHVARLRGAEGTLLSLLDDGGVEPAIVIDALAAVGTERSETTLSRVARTHERSDLRDAARRALARIEERR
jgi:HEAT repeat protein